MTEIPEEKPLTVRLSAWFDMSAKLKKLRAAEMLLRKAIFSSVFPDPKEGTNNYPLDDGFVLKGVYGLERGIDQGAFDAMKEKLREAKVNTDEIVVYKPSLAKKVYNSLNDEQRHLMDQCLIIKPSSPSMEIVKPKKAK